LREVFVKDNSHGFLEILGYLASRLIDLLQDMHSDFYSFCFWRERLMGAKLLSVGSTQTQKVPSTMH